jgi:glyoxylase-like metal-dependent hydrolase (beta-lactamase superfamily II)
MTVPRAGQLATTITVGNLTILALSDGEFTMSSDFLSCRAAHDALVAEDGKVHMPIGAFLLPGDEPILIDLGFGPDQASPVLTGGNLISQLRGQGCSPEQVSVIALTHPHPDHIGWLADPDGRETFPNARLLMAAADWDHFVRDRRGEMARHLRAALERIAAQGRIELFSGEQAIGQHITALPSPGHTPGHTVYAVRDSGERAVLLGDAIYCPQQLGHADWTALSDTDPALAARTREALERDIATDGALAVGAHFPGLIASRVLTNG